MRNARRRRLLRGVGAGLSLAALAHAPQLLAQSAIFNRPLKLVVPFAAGGGTDLFARQLATSVGAQLGVQMIVENRAGAGGTLGTDFVAKAPPDGYTLLMAHTGTLAINPALYPNLPFNARTDFAAVGPFAVTPLVLVVANSSPIRSFADLLALAKAKGAANAPLTYASGGVGTGAHLSGELLEEFAAIKLLHVPYKGTLPALTDVMGGQVDFSFSVLPPALPHISGGKLRAIAVTGAKRASSLPQVPTIAESGFPSYESTLSYGVMAPRGTPEAVLQALSSALAKSLEAPAVQAALRTEGADPLSGSARDFAAQMQAEANKWGQIVHRANIKPD